MTAFVITDQSSSGDDDIPNENRETSIHPSVHKNDNSLQSSDVTKNPAKTKHQSMFSHSVITPCSYLFSTMTIITWFTLLLTLSLHYIHDEYVMKLYYQLTFNDTRKMTERTYYERDCDSSDLTASTLSDITVDSSKHSTSDAVDMMLMHGGVIIPQVLSPNTTRELRDYIYERNQATTSLDDQYYVHEQNHRWSLKLKAHDHPVIAKALGEIGRHDVFRPLVEEMSGPHPTVGELTSISSGYGAVPQWWHADVAILGNPTFFGGSMHSTYTLFTSLQDTTREMGATRLCPGSHMCPFPHEETTSMCDDVRLFAEVDAGTAYFMDQATWHSGGSHVDRNAPDRLIFVVSFTSSPKRGDTLTLPTGLTYSLEWDMWGHTIEDLESVDKCPWSWWTSLGIWKRGGLYWGWTYPMINLMLAATGGISQTKHPDLRAVLFDFVTSAERILPILYGVILIASAGVMRFKMKASSRSQRRLLIMGHLLAMLLVALVMTWFCNTEWARTVYSQQKFTPPAYPAIPTSLPPTYYKRLQYPEAQDVIFTDRLDKYFLYAKRRFMDYHPGNRAYLEGVAFIGEWYSNFPVPMRMELITTFIDEMMEEERTFLQQNDYGDWEKIEDKAILFERTRQAIVRNQNSFLFVISQKIDFIVNDAKYGYHHRISRQFVPGLMNHLKMLILEEGQEMKPPMHGFLNLKKKWYWENGINVQSNFMRSFMTFGMLPLTHHSKMAHGSSGGR